MIMIGGMKTALFALFLILGGSEAMAFRVESPAFQEKEKFPALYTCDGKDSSPPLAWFEVPQGTKGFALIADDPDAPIGTWVHWVVYNIPLDTQELGEGVAKDEVLANGAKQGMTDFRRVGYGGPCPPPGAEHRYVFKLYALDTSSLNVQTPATKADLLMAMNGHVLAEAKTVGLYKRS